PAWLKPLFYPDSFLLRFDSLAFGCLAAVLLMHRRAVLEKFLNRSPYLTFLTGLFLVVIPELSFHRMSIVLWFESKYTIQALGFLILLLHSVVAAGLAVYRPLNWAWVRHIGVLSYSIYIWQHLLWPGPTLFDPWWGLGLWIVFLWALAATSYYGLE